MTTLISCTQSQNVPECLTLIPQNHRCLFWEGGMCISVCVFAPRGVCCGAALKGARCWNSSIVSDNGVLGQQECLRQTKSQMDGNI